MKPNPDQEPHLDGADLAQLEEELKCLTSRNRLLLLSQLQEPKTVNEIKLKPAVHREGENEDRQLTRQGVRHHLSQLEELGLVRAEVRDDDTGRGQHVYVVDESAVFGVLERVRDAIAPGSSVPLEPFQTQSREQGEPGDWPVGPKLALLRGGGDAETFSLRELEPNEQPSRGWMIGRSPEAEISLQYDPFLSAKNTEILEADDGYEIVDLRTSRNGTVLNDEQLETGQEVELEHGDVIRVGCSALVFHDE